ncbi:MAG: type I DNA topoisomerase [Clostridiales bacterium]
MTDYLVIVESPAKAKTIGKFLGRKYKITASMGHIRDLPKSQMGVDVENDFQPKYITIRGKGSLISKLKKEAKSASKVLLATDPDREGEAISWHLANILKIDESEKCRITFNEITKNAVKDAVKSPREIDMDLVDAQQARRILDRIVGYKISPLLWKKVRKGLSAGRVQSVATRLICDREEEINKFKPEEYWSLTAMLIKKPLRKPFEAKFYGNKKGKVELKNNEQVNKIIKKIGSKNFEVVKVKRGTKKKFSSPPFITSTMQQEASRKLGFTTKKCMIVAQQLYEGIEIKGQGAIGLVTYIRSDSLRVSKEAQEDARELIINKYGKAYVPTTIKQFKNKNASQDAHESIRPTYISMEPESIKDSLSRDQFRLYKLIWERFIASQMMNALYDTLSVEMSVEEYIFRSSGSKVKFEGFMKVYTEGKDNDSEDENVKIPDLKEGDKLSAKEILPKQHFTQPPPRFTEATLIKTMEEKGIGRPSTYAPTISTILFRGYIEKERKQLFPTELGQLVNDIMKNYFKDIVNVKFTAQLEGKLDHVEEGEKKWIEIMKEFYPQFADVLKYAEDDIGDLEIKDEVTDILCEKCGKNMVIKYGRFGKFLACPGFPDCRNTKAILEEAGVECPKCSGKVIIRKTKKRRKYLGCENYPDCDFMSWNRASKDLCPKCGKFLLIKNSGKKEHFICSNEECDYEKKE